MAGEMNGADYEGEGEELEPQGFVLPFLTRREYFAGQALIGIISQARVPSIKQAVDDAVRIADAMITRLEAEDDES